MLELLLPLIAVGLTVFTLVRFLNELMKKDEYIAELQTALVDAYAELELRKLGVMK